jgi:DNA-binding NarL/FixJ family response regulator
MYDEAVPSPKSTVKPVTVAIVEDDAIIRQGFAEILARAADVKCVGQFSNGEEATAALPALQPRVILMDINLPGIDGVECVRRVSEQLPLTSIVMLTVQEDTDAIFNSLAAGASGYLLKPVRAAALLAAIRDVFAGGAPMSAYVARKVVQSFQRGPKEANDLDQLSPRENDILELLSHGLTYKEIGDRFDVSYATVRTHIERIYKKLHVHSRSHAISKYLGGAD